MFIDRLDYCYPQWYTFLLSCCRFFKQNKIFKNTTKRLIRQGRRMQFIALFHFFIFLLHLFSYVWRHAIDNRPCQSKNILTRTLKGLFKSMIRSID